MHVIILLCVLIVAHNFVVCFFVAVVLSLQEVRDAIQKRFIEAANDNIELHQANIKALQEQHKRELKLLHADMSELRAK